MKAAGNFLYWTAAVASGVFVGEVIFHAAGITWLLMRAAGGL